MIAMVASNKKDNTSDIPSATKYWCKNPLLISTCFEDSKPPKIPFNPFAIKKIDRINPVESKPE